jgi:3-deoxy-D-arabino-heptulosonate 7-phosphate (DAHP) synthase
LRTQAIKMRKLLKEDDTHRVAEELKEDLLIIMRVYFEKPRTTVGCYPALLCEASVHGRISPRLCMIRTRLLHRGARCFACVAQAAMQMCVGCMVWSGVRVMQRVRHMCACAACRWKGLINDPDLDGTCNINKVMM